MCRIAGRHGVTGHPVRHDRITAEVNRVMAGIDPKDLHSELYEFITETRPHWSESRRTAYATDLAAHIRPPTSPRAT
jgi:hypothetical protein